MVVALVNAEPIQMPSACVHIPLSMRSQYEKDKKVNYKMPYRHSLNKTQAKNMSNEGKHILNGLAASLLIDKDIK